MSAGEAGEANLGAAALALLDDVAAGLSGEQRFRVLMALSALRMAERERGLGMRLAESAAAILSAGEASSFEDVRTALRSGVGLTPALHAALLKDAVVQTAVTKPGALTAEEKASVGLQ